MAHENHAIQLYSNQVMLQKVDYIHTNPVRNGLVEKLKVIYLRVQKSMLVKLGDIHNKPGEEMIVSKPEEFLFSSPRNYAG